MRGVRSKAKVDVRPDSLRSRPNCWRALFGSCAWPYKGSPGWETCVVSQSKMRGQALTKPVEGSKPGVSMESFHNRVERSEKLNLAKSNKGQSMEMAWFRLAV